MYDIDGDKKVFFEPWLAGASVSLIANRMPAKNIRNWTQPYASNLHIKKPDPGRTRKPVLYSLASAFQLYGMQMASDAGFTLPLGLELGNKINEYILKKMEDGYISLLHPEIFPLEEDVFVFKRNITKGAIVLYASDFGPLSSYLKENMRLVPDCYGATSIIESFVPVGQIVEPILWHYFEITTDFNNKLLEGKLKPIPKEIPKKQE